MKNHHPPPWITHQPKIVIRPPSKPVKRHSSYFWIFVYALMLILIVIVAIAFTGCVSDNHSRAFVQVESGIIINLPQPQFATTDTILIRYVKDIGSRNNYHTIVGNYTGTLPDSHKTNNMNVSYIWGIIIQTP